MTILERRRRVQERSTSCKKPRELLLNHHPSRSTQFSVASSQSKQKVSSLLQSLQYKNRRNRQMEKPRPDVIVMRAIRETVRELLREQPTISLHNMANALAANEYIFELYSMPLMDRDVYQTCQPNSGAYSMMQSLAASLKSKLSIFSNDTTSDRNEKQNSLDRKYQLTNAFSKLRNTTGSASTIMIRSWEDAKAHLATVFDLGSLGPETSEEPNESDRVVHKYDRALRDISRESLLEKPIGMTPSQLRFQEMAKLGQVPKAISEPLQQQIEAAYQKREELENARLDKLRAIEEETKRKEQEAEAKKRAAELMRQMTTEEQDLVKKALYGIGPNTEVIAKIGSDTCQRGSIQRLQPGEWLNDEVIHYFLIMLSLRDEQLVNEGKRSRRSHFFKSYFMTKLMNDGDSEKDGMYEYKNVKRWSKNVPGKDIFNLDKIFFPVNVGRTHWVVAVAFMQQKRIQFFDSFGDSGYDWMEAVFRYIKDEHMDKNKSPLPDEDEWELVPCVRGTPRQLNGYDCGVFTCMFCDFLSKDCPLVFNQDHITQCRERICLSILNGRAIL